MTNVEVNDGDDVNDDDKGDDVMNLRDDVFDFDDDDEDDDAANMDQGGDLSGFDDDELLFNFEQGDDLRPSNKEINPFFDDVHDVVQSTMETEGVGNVLKVTPPTTNQMANTSVNLDSTIRIPPLIVATPATLPSEGHLSMTLAS